MIAHSYVRNKEAQKPENVEHGIQRHNCRLVLHNFSPSAHCVMRRSRSEQARDTSQGLFSITAAVSYLGNPSTK